MGNRKISNDLKECALNLWDWGWDQCTYARRYGQAFLGERAELKDVFVRGDRYSLVAALTINGYIAVEAIPGSFDSMDFLEFIQEQVVHSKRF